MRSAPGRREAHGKPAQSCVTAGVGGRNAAGATGRRSRRGASPPRRQGAEEDPPLRRDLPGEPLLRQPVRRLGAGRRRRRRRSGAHDPGQPGRGAVPVPAAERRQPDVASAHRQLHEHQPDGGRQNRYVTGSDAVGLAMGYYDTRKLPIYRYLHRRGHPKYVISDRFFQAAFGGSFLNHQWLIAAASPEFYGALGDGTADDLHSLVDANGMPTSYPLYTATGAVKDAALTVPCASPHPAGLACGDWAVNTIQPPYQPYAPGTAPARRLPPQKGATIGDRLSEEGVDWAWYSGGWSNANGDIGGPGWTNGPTSCTDPETATGAIFPNCPNKLSQYHHQPFNYYENYATGTQARIQHLRDEDEFEALADASDRRCKLKPVSFVKPIGAENEHPGYASEHSGSDHVVDLLRAVRGSRCRRNTMIVITYDEFGGQWDHVPPPGQGATTPGPSDDMGPGSRIPALTLAPRLHRRFRVDRASHDTTSIIATLVHRFGLEPVAERDAEVKDLSTVFRNRHRHHHGQGGHH